MLNIPLSCHKDFSFSRMKMKLQIHPKPITLLFKPFKALKNQQKTQVSPGMWTLFWG